MPLKTPDHMMACSSCVRAFVLAGRRDIQRRHIDHQQLDFQRQQWGAIKRPAAHQQWKHAVLDWALGTHPGVISSEAPLPVVCH